MAVDKMAIPAKSKFKEKEHRIAWGTLITLICLVLAYIAFLYLAPGNRNRLEMYHAREHHLIWIEVNKHLYHKTDDPWYGRSDSGPGLFAPEWLAKATGCRLMHAPPGGWPKRML